MTTHDFTALPDLASRAFGGSVSAANDELFAQRALIRAEAPYFDPNEFGHKERCTTDGKPVAAAATRTIAIVRLGTPGIIHGIIVDTAYFKGNYPPFVSVEAASIEGYPSVEEIMKRTGRPSSRSPRPRVTPPMLTRLPTGTGGLMCDSRSIPTVGSRGCAYTASGTGSTVPRWNPGPAGRGKRWPAGRLLGRVLCVSGEHHPSRPGPQHGGRLGERAPTRWRQRLCGVRPCRSRTPTQRRDRHQLLRR